MTNQEAMKLALEALEDIHPGNMTPMAEEYWGKAITALRQALSQPDPFDRLIRIMGTFDLSTGHADSWTDLLDSLESELRDVLGYYREMFKAEPKCNPHPDAPHGFDRDASHSLGRYVCDCEGWEPKREWQGLTDEELSQITDEVIGFNSCWSPEGKFARAIEAKLKEKNT